VPDTCQNSMNDQPCYIYVESKCLEEKRKDSDVGRRWGLQLENRSPLLSFPSFFAFVYHPGSYISNVKEP
jgi:hypothetical protein